MIRCDRVIVERAGQMVIDRLSLAVGAGEALAVIGGSAAGKTTLVEAIATALPVRGGDIAVAGHSVRRDPDAVRARIGYVPAHLTARPAVRADEFLALFAGSAGLVGGGLSAAVDRALEFDGLQGRGETPIDRLPDGQAKLLLVGRALLHGPDALVFDDPFGGLDPRQRRTVERLIGDMQIGGRAVIAALDDARVPDCFTHLAVLDHGRIVEQGPATFAAFSAGRSWRYRFRCPGRAEAAAALIGRLVDRVEAGDADTLDCTLPAGRQASGQAVSTIIRTLVEAGIPVEEARLHPVWTAQLLEPFA